MNGSVCPIDKVLLVLDLNPDKTKPNADSDFFIHL
jgi:hypothetical protein